jgi:hypothetical protein
MPVRAARYSHEELAQRGQQICERDVRPGPRPEDDGKLVAIDIKSAGYELDRNDRAATDRLLSRYPDAQIWLVQVGQPAAYRIGARSASEGAG